MNITKETLSKARVLVVGDAMIDRYWYGAVDRISPEAPVPVVRITREEERIGGAANVAINVVARGAKASRLTVGGVEEPGPQQQRLAAGPGAGRPLGVGAAVGGRDSAGAASRSWMGSRRGRASAAWRRSRGNRS